MHPIRSSFALLVFTILCLSSTVHAQDITCSLTDATGEGVPFANVYVPSASKGTVSNMNGVFSLSLKQAAADSIVTISCIGYETKKLALRGLLNGTITSIALEAANYELAQATVVGSNLDYNSPTTLGNPKRNKSVTGGYTQDSTASAGMELGNLMKTKRNWMLDKAGFHIRGIGRDSMKFEVNVYNARKGFPDAEPINRKRIFLTVDSTMLTEPIMVDFSNQNIYGKGDFLVTLELLDDINSTDYVSFPANMKKGLSRYKSGAGKWRKAPFFMSVGIWAEVREAE
ncbi:MAG: carboxypeptidase-like regulatory domain-containing protein [Saprospiraceae bacterium]